MAPIFDLCNINPCTFLQFLNEAQEEKNRSQKIAGDTKKFFTTNITVADDFDQTPPRLKRWDEVFLDQDVLGVLELIYEPPPDVGFAESIGYEIADSYYSRPYCYQAKNIGYGALERYYKSDTQGRTNQSLD